MTPYNIQNTDFSLDDIKQVVNIHRQEIRQGFLSSLGNKALELLFSLAVESNYGVLLIAKNANNRKVCGFLLGTVDTGKFYKDFLIKKSFQAIIVLIPKMLSLDTIRKLMETLFYPSKSEIQDMPNAELLDIAIVKEHQGTGLARSLF